MYFALARVATVVSVALVTAMAAAEAVSANPFTFGNPGFCAPKKPVRDFGFSKLPPVREVPESAQGLGHGAVTMFGGWPRVMTKPWSVGYGFSEHTYSEDGVRLNWTVTAQLWTIDGRGRTLREIDRRKLFIGRLNATRQPEISVDPLRGRRGFYRFDMQITNQAGRMLGSYGTYFKVVHPSWRPSLRLSSDVARPGERLLFRLENYGSESISYGAAFRVRRFEDGRWVLARDLTPRPWPKWLRFLGPGATGGCTELPLPADTPPGLYRVSKVVGTERYPDGKAELLTAFFEVVGSSPSIEY